MSEWFLKREGKSFGPFTLDHVKALVAHGKLRADDLVWQEESKEWVAASTIKELFPAKPTGAARPVEVTAKKPVAVASAVAAAKPPAPAPERQAAPSFLQRLRLWPKPILFGTFGAVGGLLGALFLGELLWYILEPVPPKVEAVPPLQMSLPDSFKVYPQGKKAEFQVKIARHGFKGKVQLKAIKPPAGITVEPITLDGDKDEEEAKVKVHVDSDVDPDTYQIVFEAKGPAPDKGETPIVTKKLELVVAALPPSLSLSVSPMVQVYSGKEVEFPVRIRREGFGTPVTVSFPGLPKGIELADVVIPAGETEQKAVLKATEAAPGDLEINAVATAKVKAGKELENQNPQSIQVKIQPLPLNLSLSVSPKVQVYRGGKEVEFTVRIKRDGFQAPVQVSFPGLPKGIELPDLNISDVAEEQKVLLKATDAAPLGDLEIKAVATAKLRSGEELKNQNPQKFDLKVEALPRILALSVSPQVKVYKKGKAEFLVRIARSNFTEPVKVSFLFGADPGIILKDVVIPSGSNESSIVLEASAEAIEGKKKVTVLAQAQVEGGAKEPKDQQQQFELEVLPTPSAKADVLFVLDLTGSMQFAINGVRDGITSFAKQLEEQNIDARIGMLGYRDIEDDVNSKESPPFVVFLNGEIISMNSREDFDRLLEKMKAGNTDIFTKAKDHVKFGQMVGKLKEGGGGDIPESTNQAMIYAAKQGFRPDASKVLVLITDAPPKLRHFKLETETVPQTVKALKDANIDQVHLVVQPIDRDMHYFQFLDAFPGKNSFNDINKLGAGNAFAALLPKLSAQISKNTVAATPDLKKVETPTLKPVEPPPSPPSLPPPVLASATAGDLPPPKTPALPPSKAAELPPPPPPPALTKALQSDRNYAKEQDTQLILAVGIWTAAVAAAICLLLIASQNFYLGRVWLTPIDYVKACGGLAAGLIGGLVVQALYVQVENPGAVWEIVCRTVGWGTLGAMIGGGMSLVVPNLSWYRGLQGGLLGGIIGAFAFILATVGTGAFGGRLLGSAILGFLIGVMIALAEMVYRRFWLELTFSAREIRTVTLGTAAVSVGGDERLASIFVQGAPPLGMCYRVDGEKVMCEDPTTGKITEAPPGHRSQVGNVIVTVCSPESAATLGITLKLSNGKALSLGDGMPLTADDLPGLSPQGTDGTVALISRRPNDPKAMMLRNRSKQTWTATDANGQQSEVQPGRAVELSADLALNFGDIKGKLVSAKGK